MLATSKDNLFCKDCFYMYKFTKKSSGKFSRKTLHKTTLVPALGTRLETTLVPNETNLLEETQ